jgi:hypothetical protein
MGRLCISTRIAGSPSQLFLVVQDLLATPAARVVVRVSAYGNTRSDAENGSHSHPHAGYPSAHRDNTLDADCHVEDREPVTSGV